MITKLNPNVIQDGSITAEKLADGIANDIISSLSTQSTLPSLTDYYIGQNAGGHTETYFKKTLQSIGSVFQHELYDKVYLKDGSDPTFGNITAWQLNLSENSYVTHADGFGLALCVNDCAFLVGEEDGVYYLDAAGNTQTMLHSGNIGNYKLSQLTNNNQTFIGRTDGIISNTDADNFTDSGAYLFQTGNGDNNTNFPITGYGILNVFNSPYGNRTTNYIGQLLLGTYSTFYRTKVDTWSDWKQIALTSDIPTSLPASDVYTWAKAATKPTYTASEVGALAQDNSQVDADIDTILENKTAVLKPFFQSFASNDIGSARKGILRMTYNGSESQLLFDHYTRLLHYRTIGENPKDWATLAFTSDIPTKLSQLTDDVVAGKYLPLSGGTISGTFRQLYTGSYDGAVAHSILCNIAAPYGLITRINGNGDVLQQAQRENTNAEWFNLRLQPLGGNVGIGNTLPTERLDVSGNIKASGNINATSITINGVTITASNGSITVNGNAFATGDITGGV